MTLYFADVVTDGAALKNMPPQTVYIAVRRNAKLLTELAQQYECVRVVSLERGHLLSGIAKLCRAKLKFVITQQTFSQIPFKIKMTAWICARLNGASLVGFTDRASYNQFLYDRLLTFDTTALFPSGMCRLAASIGFAGACPQPTLRWSATSVDRGTAVVFHLMAFRQSRSWPSKRWQQLIKDMRTRWPERQFIFTGSKSDKAFIDESIAGTAGCVNRAGDLPLSQLIQTLDSAALFVGVDTGITHLAAFRKVPSVIIGNRSNPSWWSTYSPATTWLTAPERCGCNGNKTGDCQELVDGHNYYRCLIDITETQVLAAAELCLK